MSRYRLKNTYSLGGQGAYPPVKLRRGGHGVIHGLMSAAQHALKALRVFAEIVEIACKPRSRFLSYFRAEGSRQLSDPLQMLPV